MENLYSGSFWCNYVILIKISSGSSDFGESFKDQEIITVFQSFAQILYIDFVLCTEKQSTEYSGICRKIRRKNANISRNNQWNADFKSILIAAEEKKRLVFMMGFTDREQEHF